MDEINHNHPPLCCCPDLRTDYRPSTICPLCPEHGELAQLSKRRTD